MPIFATVFALDKHGCPSCGLELVPHPTTGRWVCPRCKFERARMHEPRTVPITREEVCPVGLVGPAIVPVVEIHPITTAGESQPVDIASKIDAEIALAEASATTRSVDPETIFISGTELGKRWNMTANGALMKAERLGIPILKNNSGFKAVREVDLALADESKAARLPRKVAAERAEPIVEQMTDQVMPLSRPIVHYEAVQVGDSERVRRLLLALKSIVDLTAETDGAPTFAVWALASYAIAAESTG